jgi:hypothetical protein
MARDPGFAIENGEAPRTSPGPDSEPPPQGFDQRVVRLLTCFWLFDLPLALLRDPPLLLRQVFLKERVVERFFRIRARRYRFVPLPESVFPLNVGDTLLA